MPPTWPLDWLRSQLQYEPRNAALFEAALTHRSAHGRNNERLEFLGDAVLSLAVTERLFALYPDADEGDLSRLRARVVSAEPLADAAQALGVGDVLRLGSGELKTGGFRRQSILADALEALIGAIYLDRGFEAAREVVLRLLGPRIESAPRVSELKDPKTRLQEMLQSRALPLPVYRVDRVDGEPHAQHFEVRCEVAAFDTSGRGAGSSRRRAEQDAAREVLALLGERSAS
jgi:ribonuclease III